MDFINQNMETIIWAAGFLVALFVLLVLWRAFSPAMMGRRGQRLGISEYHELDKTRRLVLVRRDNVEHLILIGGNQDVLIEQGITAAGVASAYGAAPVAPGMARPAPRGPQLADRNPPSLRTVEPSGPVLRRDDEP